MYFHTAICHVKGDITGMKKVVSKIFLDHIALVSAADNEVIDTVVAVDLKDVPENWLPADFYHRLWPQMGFLRQTGT